MISSLASSISFSAKMCIHLPSGVLCLTAIYIGIVVAVQLTVPRCLPEHEPCNLRGVDDATNDWVTDLFSALCMACFATHLLVSGRRVRNSGILAQIFMAGASSLGGIGRWMLGNNGENNGRGMLGYWIIAFISYIFATIATVCHGYFVRETSAFLPMREIPFWADKFLLLFQALVVLACTCITFGSVWCIISSGHDIQSSTHPFGQYNSSPMCIRWIHVSQAGFIMAWALFWIPAALLLRASAAPNDPQTFLGLTSSWAALSIPVIQWTLGSLFVGYVCLEALIQHEVPFGLGQMSWGLIVCHYVILVTFYLAHNVCYIMVVSSHSKHDDRTKEKVTIRPALLSSPSADMENGMIVVPTTSTLEVVQTNDSKPSSIQEKTSASSSSPSPSPPAEFEPKRTKKHVRIMAG